MRRATALLAAAVLMLLAGTIGATSAAASRGIGMRTEEITGTAEPATFTSSEGAIRIRCRGRIRARFSPEIPKSRGSHIGNLSFAGATECRNEIAEATVTFLRGPWEMGYQTFNGTLPAISSVLANIVQLEFLIQLRLLGGTILACLYRAEAEALIEPETLEYLAGASARLVTRLTGECPAIIILGGSFALSPRQRLSLL